MQQAQRLRQVTSVYAPIIGVAGRLLRCSFGAAQYSLRRVTSPVRPTTALRGPASVAPRQLVVLVVGWVLWYFAASLALDTLARLAPAPALGGLP